MTIFNQYGAMLDPETSRIDSEIHTKVYDFLQQLVDQGTDLTTIRAVGGLLSMSIQSATAEVVLRKAMNMRTKEKQTIILKPVLQIPKVWRELLEIDLDLNDAKKKPFQIAVDEPTPYRYDYRCTSITDQGFTVILSLSSGVDNYWLYYEVTGPQFHLRSKAFYDVPTEQDEIYLGDIPQDADGKIVDQLPPLYFHVELI